MTDTSLSAARTTGYTLKDGNAGADDTLTVTGSGSVKTSGAVAIGIDATNAPAGAGIVINNSGTISASAARTIDVTSKTAASGTKITLNNYQGAILSASGGANDKADVFRIDPDLPQGVIAINNAGTIQSTGTSNDSQGLRFGKVYSDASITITNTATGLIKTANADAIRAGNNSTITNAGTIVALGSDTPTSALYTTHNAIDISIGQRSTIINTGTIVGEQSALGSDVGYNGTKTATTDTPANYIVTNRSGGTITGNNSGAIVSSGIATITNEAGATIKGLGAGSYNGGSTAFAAGKMNYDGDGIDVVGTATITNAGLIQGVRSAGVNNSGRGNSSEGVDIGGGSIVNSGTIEGGAFGVTVNNTGNANQTRSGSAALTLTNQAGGLIQGDSGYAIRSENRTADGSATAALTNDTVVNYGTIVGNGTVPSGTVYLNGGTATADSNTVGMVNGVAYTSSANAGSARFILGDGAAIQLGEGDDTLTNYGTITGNSGRAISLEGGNDTLNLYTGGTVTGRIDGGVGTDTLNLGAASGSATGTLAGVVNFEILNVNGGTWTVADAESFANGITIAGGAKLVVGAGGSLDGAITDNGTLVFSHADALTAAGAISGSGGVVQAGSGILTLSGANSYTGGTALNAGTLDIASAAGAGTGSITFGSGAQTLHLEQAALTQTGSAASFANTLSGFGPEDTLDIGGIGAATGVAYDASSRTLQVTGGTEAVTLQLDAGAAPRAGYAYGVTSDGNGGSLVAIEAVPTVTGLSANLSNGSLGAGATVAFTITTSSAVSVSGAAPVLHLNDGGIATYDAAHSTATSLVFSYTVAAGQNAASLSITGIDNGGGVQDAAHVGLDFGNAIGQAGIGPQIDTTAPVLGFGSTGGLTNQATQTVSGTVDAADAGATITIYEGATVLNTAVADGQGNWSASVSFTGNGDHAIVSRATDAAGNTGTSAPLTYTLDTTPPTVTITTAGGLTNQPTQVVSGQVDSGHAGLTVSITENGAVVGTATIAGDGSWSTNVTLSGDGTHTLLASDTDQAGNTGTSAPLRFVLDTTAPTLAVTSTGGLTNHANQIISGTVGAEDAGTTVSISDNGSVIGTATVASDGTWSTGITLSGDGTHTLSATDTDAAGNTGHSAGVSYTLDTTAPTLAVASTGGLTDHANQTVSGTVGVEDAGTTVSISDNGTVIGTATVKADGSWSTGVTLTGDGAHTLSATDTDAAGNTGTSASVGYTLDTTAPVVAIANAGGLTNQAHQTLSGTVGVADAGTIVSLSENGTLIGSATVKADGSWSADVTLAGDGTHAITAFDTDAAGNTGHSTALAYTLDTTAPDVDFTSYGGTVHAAAQTVRGTAGIEDAGSTVSIYEADRLLGTAVVRSDGRWSANVTLSGDGTHTLTATDTDAAGNTGTADQTLSLTLDTKALTFDVGNLVLSVYGNGDGSGDYVDNNATPITLEQITTSGQIVGRFVLPQTTSVTNGVTNSVISGEYGSSSEGSLQLSGDGHWLVIAGYGINADTYNDGGAAIYGDARLAQSTSVAGGQYIPVSRVIAKIGADGSVDTSTVLYNVYNTNNPRSVATTDGTDFYISGQGKKGDTTQGVFLVHDGGTTATPIDTSTDTRTIEIVNGQLYVSRDSKQGSGGTSNLGTYGTTLPTSATAAVALPGISTSVHLGSGQGNTVNGPAIGTNVSLSPENYFFANATTLYIADSGNPKQGGLGDGGLQKWVFDGAHWTLQYTLSEGLGLVRASAESGTTGLIGLTGRVVGDTVELYATNATVGDVDQTYVFGIKDKLAATSGVGESFTTLVTAEAGTNIRGISFAPTPVAPVVTVTNAGGATNQANHLITGSVAAAYAGTTVSILDGSTVIGTTTVQSDGSWSAKVTLTGDGKHTLVATDTDSHGTTGTSAAVVYTLDQVAPLSPVLEIAAPVGATLPKPALSGTAEAGATVSLYDNGTLIATTTADAVTGIYGFDSLPTLAAGSHALTTRAADAAGNLGNVSGEQTVVVNAAGAITSMTQFHTSKTKDVYLLNITGRSYVAEHDTYKVGGVLTDVIRTHADETTDYTYHLDTATGTKTTDTYSAAGLLVSDVVLKTDGTSDTKVYASDGKTLATETIRYGSPANQSEISDTFQYTNGVLTREVQLHANQSKDIYLTNVTGKSYVAEHDVFNAGGVLTDIARTHADGTSDYVYHLDTTTGAKTTDSFNAAGLLLTDVVLQTNGTTDTKVYASDGRTLVSETIRYGASASQTEISNTFQYTNGILTTETQLHADKSRDVYLSNIKGRSYVAEHDTYTAGNLLTDVARTHADGTFDYRFHLDTVSGTKTTDGFNAAGLQLTSVALQTNGTTDTKVYASDGKTLATDTIRYVASPGQTEISDTFQFTNGVLTRETKLHADQSKDIYTSAITGKSYVSEHVTYTAAGLITDVVRLHADNSLDYLYHLDTATGAKTTDTFNAAGLLLTEVTLQANGTTDTKAYASDGKTLASETIRYAASPGQTEISDTRQFTNGVLTRETLLHADQSKDIYDFAVSNKPYTADHYAYGPDGKIETLDLTYADGSHAQTAYQAGQTLISTLGAVDTFKSFGGDSFVFAAGFGKDVVTGFHAGPGGAHDVLTLDTSEAANFQALQTNHMIAASGRDTLITLSSTDTILLKNVAPSALTSDNFHFQDHGLFHA